MIDLLNLVRGKRLDTESGAVPALETSRLRLRRWSSGDVQDYARMIRDPEVMRYLGCGWKYKIKRTAASFIASMSDVEARLTIRRLARHWRDAGFGEWAVEEKASGALIGQIGLTYHPDWAADPAKIEIGWLLARRAWGNGYATEAAKVSLAYAFDRLQLGRIVSITHVANVRSQRVMQRIGMEHVGQTHWNGCDVLWCAMDRMAWDRASAR